MHNPPPKTETPLLTVIMLERSRTAEAAVVLCVSHADYPALAHLFPNAQRRQKILRSLFAATVRDAQPWLAPDRIAAFAAPGHNTERAFPDGPHWYLEVLGVRPASQGLGVGSALLQPALVRADRDRLPCHLETSDPANLAFYERFGFTFVEDHQLVVGGPPHYSMRRSARSSSKA